MSAKLCWEIMKCDRAEDCIAKQDQSKKCWEHSQALGAAPDHFSVCPDCLVYIANSQNYSVNFEEITQLRQELSSLESRQRCPLAGFVDFKNAVVERREVKRISCNGFLKASLSMADIFNFSCQPIDLSQTGLAFICSENVLVREKSAFLHLSSDSFTLQDVPVQIVANFSSSASEPIRYGARFHDLNSDQQAGISNLLQACAGS